MSCVLAAASKSSIQVDLEEGSPVVFARLPERPWGPTDELPKHVVDKLMAGAQSGSSLCVLRDSFSSFDQRERPVSQLMRKLPGGVLAMSSDLCRPHSRTLVDEYDVDAATGAARRRPWSFPVDLVSYVHQQEILSVLVPDVEAAEVEAMTAVRGGKPVAAPAPHFPPSPFGRSKAALDWPATVRSPRTGSSHSPPLANKDPPPPPPAPSHVSCHHTQGVRQSTNTILMVSPTAFGFNEQAAQDNSFMHVASAPGAGSELTRTVLREYAGLHHALTEVAGVQVEMYEHHLSHGTPDAVFPNNWFSTHAEGEGDGKVGEATMVLYPMKCPNRSAERRVETIQSLRSRFDYSKLVDMSGEEANKKYFEGTGVLVLDRINGTAYVDLSERADAGLAADWVEKIGYSNLVTFRSSDLRGSSVYHTNVMMAIGTGVAIVCAESVKDDRERQHLLASLRKTHEVVEISLKQQDSLCGNALEVEGGKGLPLMAMSTQAYRAFTDDQLRVIRRHVQDIVHAPIDTLERVGGGGVRCTLAELF
ncbi:MAG: hypothetical protein WDW36_006499 [Sanguina aurantia]